MQLLESFNNQYYKNQLQNYLIISGATALFFFGQTFGFSALNPRNNAWLMYGDWAQCYLGWEFYRISPFGVPLGDAPSLFFPHGSNLIYTDSVPWFSILMKPISLLFKGTFQHLGFWFLICFMLQMFFSMLIIREFKMKSSIAEILASLIIFLSPLFFHRFYHATLSSHWIVLACIWNYIRIPSSRSLLLQTLLNTAAAFTNPYFCVFTGSSTVALVGKLYFSDKLKDVLKISKFFLLQGGIVIFVWFIMGYFSISQSDTIETGTLLGFYSSNLNSFWNPIWGTSKILQPLPLHHLGQYEGYGYLGFGIILSIIVIAFYYITNNSFSQLIKEKLKNAYIIPLVVCLFILFLYALSQKITLYETLIFQFSENQFIEKYLSIFRSSGRFIWIIGYSVTALALYCLNLIFLGNASKIIAFSVVLFIQAYDIFDPLVVRYRIQNDAKEYESKLKNPLWDSVFVNCKNIYPYPSHERKILHDEDYIDFLYKSVKNENVIATGYLARYNNKITKEFNSKLLDDIRQSNVDVSTAIITTKEHFYEIEDAIVRGKNVVIFEIDDYFVIMNSQNKLAISLNLKTEGFTKYPVLKRLLEENQDKIIIVSGKDEFTLNLTQDDRSYIRSIGGSIDLVNFRGSYAGVFFGGKLIAENYGNGQTAKVFIPIGTKLGNLEARKALEIVSEGKSVKEEGDVSIIKIDQNNVSVNKRGLNIAILDQDMNLISTGNFDTFMYGYSFRIPDFSK